MNERTGGGPVGGGGGGGGELKVYAQTFSENHSRSSNGLTHALSVNLFILWNFLVCNITGVRSCFPCPAAVNVRRGYVSLRFLI